MKHILLLTLGVLLGVTTFSQTADPNAWMPDGRVRHITRGDGKIFLSGEFRWFGEIYGGNIPVLNLDLSHDDTFPKIQYRATRSIADDAGGWYTLGDGAIGHFKADKTFEILPITFTGSFLYDFAKSGNILYVVGQFTSVNGTPRAYMAAIDLTTNTVTSWNPGSNGTVYSVAVFGSTVYVGGPFSIIGGLTRHKIAAIDAATGATTSWNANAISSFGYVLDIIPTATEVYFGGNFSNVGGGSPSRRNFAAVNSTTGALLTFNPRPDNHVHDLLLDGTTLYIAGEYTQIGGVSRYGLTAFDTGTGSLLSFNPTFSETYDGPVNSMAISGTNLYVGGDFLSVNDTDQAKIAVLDKTTGALVSTADRDFSDEVYTISIVGSKVLVGCYNLAGISGESGTRQLAALDEATGQGVGWVPQLPSIFSGWFTEDIHFQDNKLYYWQSLDESPVQAFGALNPNDGSVDPTFAAVEVTGTVTAWAFSANTLYIAGDFTQVNGTPRSNFAAVNLANGALLPFAISSPVNGADVWSMIVSNDVLYISGDFELIDGGITRTKLAAWNASSGTLLAWAPQLTLAPFEEITISTIHDGKLYLAGSDVKRVNANNGAVDNWAPDYSASQVAIQGNYAYICGGFSPGLARVSIVSGNPSLWQPSIDDVYDSEGSVYTVLASTTKLYVGGNFSFDRPDDAGQYFAIFDLPTEVANEPPQIQASTSATHAGGVVTIDLTGLISDPDDNLNLPSLSLLNNVSEQGAAASLDASSYILKLEYDGTVPKTDTVSIEVCDLLEACTQQMLAIDIGSLDLVVYNAVSPNGDGKNDQFTLQNIPPNNNVTIFNRWGAVVFEMANYDNQARIFRGLSNSGSELPPGTYYYRIDFPDGMPPRTGYLSLRR